MIIGIGLYGRSFNLVSPAETRFGARTKGKGPSGQFTREAGFMAYYEVTRNKEKFSVLYLRNEFPFSRFME